MWNRNELIAVAIHWSISGTQHCYGKHLTNHPEQLILMCISVSSLPIVIWYNSFRKNLITEISSVAILLSRRLHLYQLFIQRLCTFRIIILQWRRIITALPLPLLAILYILIIIIKWNWREAPGILLQIRLCMCVCQCEHQEKGERNN